MSMDAIGTKLFRPSGNTPGVACDLAACLGLAAGASAEAIIDMARRGFPVSVIDKLVAELDVSKQVLLRTIALSPATLTRRRAKKQRLSPQESDRVYRIAAAYLASLRLFEGNAEAARRWFGEPAKALGGNTPLEYLDTEAGADEVQDLIDRLEHGIIT